MKPAALIEALLFSRAEPWDISELAKVMGVSTTETEVSISELEKSLENRGICLMKAGNTVTLGTHPEANAVLARLYTEELSKPLSKASVETLSIIMYGEEVTRGKIDFIRGVNSGFILRSLLIRGLIERKQYPRDRKRFMYAPTLELLAQFGVQNVESLPEYEKTHKELIAAAVGAEDTEEIPNATLSDTTDA